VNLFLKLLLFSCIFTVSLIAKGTPLEKVSLQLNWKNQFEFAGYYMAKEKGFYADEGLEVDILEYDNAIELSKSVRQNRHSFAIGYSGTVLDGANANDIVFLSAVFQSSPYVLVSLKSSGIKSIKDFKNKRIMIDSESKQNTAFISMLHAHGVSFEDMIVQDPSFKVESLVDGQTDIAAWYLSNELYLLDKRGIEYDIWDPKDYGFDFYNDLLFTSKRELQESPQIVESFTRASLKGWEYAFNHIDETVSIILQKYNTQNKSEGALLYEARVLKKLSSLNDKKLGVIEKEKIQRLLDIYNLLGLYKNNGNLDELIYKTPNKFSLTQEEKSYLQKKKVINVCVSRDKMPLEAINENNQYEGIVADILKLMQKNSNITFAYIPSDNWTQKLDLMKEKKCDVISLTMQTPSRKKYMDFTTPYVSFPFAIATKNSEIFIDNLDSLNGKKVSLIKGSASVELLRSKYPFIEIVSVDTLMQGLQLVRENKVYGHIDSIAKLAYTLRQEGISDIKIAGKFDEFSQLSFATSRDEALLHAIMQKTLDSLEEKEQDIQSIYNKWFAIKFEQKVDYVLVYEMLAVLLFFGSLGAWRYYEMHKINKIINSKNEELERMAITDQLTNIFNRRKINEILQVNKELADRYKTPFGIIILDIDRFKKVNDIYGHQVGDTTLQTFASIMTTNSRKSDTVGRWGGEEFLIIITNASEESLINFAQNLRKKIENHHFETVDHVTASLGATLYNSVESYEETVARADKALYISKESGRNCVNFLGA